MAAAATSKAPSTLRLSLAILAYLSLNLGLNLFNKIVFKRYHFNFPCIIMFTHQLLLYTVLRSLTLCGVIERPTQKTHERITGPVILVGMLFGANIIANNASLIFVSLSLNQCLKASSPVLMIFVAYLVEGKKTTPSAAAAALLTCIGAFLVVLHTPGFDFVGVLLVGASTLAAAFQYAATSVTMKGETNLVVHTTMYSALVVCFFCLPLILILELDKFHAFVQTNSLFRCLGMLLVGGSMATAYLLVINGLIAIGGTVYLTVLGNAKLALVVLASCYIFEEELTRLNIVGIVITILGFWLFSVAKQRQKKREKLQEELRKIYEEDFEDVDEERQSLLKDLSASQGGGGKSNDAMSSSLKQEHVRRSMCCAYTLEAALAVFVVCMAVALFMPPRGTHNNGAVRAARP